MENNRDGPDIRFFRGRGSPGGNPQWMMYNARGDPGMYRHARDNPTCNMQYIYMLVQF